jgi:DNA-binding transcriptional ArsR family regulator
MPRNPRPTLHHPDLEQIPIAKVFGALSEPTRLQIVRILMEEPLGRACGTFAVDVSAATLSHHFKVLRAAGLIQQEERGRRRWTSLRRVDIDRRFPGLLSVIAHGNPVAGRAETADV